MGSRRRYSWPSMAGGQEPDPAGASNEPAGPVTEAFRKVNQALARSRELKWQPPEPSLEGLEPLTQAQVAFCMGYVRFAGDGDRAAAEAGIPPADARVLLASDAARMLIVRIWDAVLASRPKPTPANGGAKAGAAPRSEIADIHEVLAFATALMRHSKPGLYMEPFSVEMPDGTREEGFRFRYDRITEAPGGVIRRIQQYPDRPPTIAFADPLPAAKQILDHYAALERIRAEAGRGQARVLVLNVMASDPEARRMLDALAKRAAPAVAKLERAHAVAVKAGDRKARQAKKPKP